MRSFFVVLVSVMTMSCAGDSPLPLYPVRGAAFFDGKPAVGAVVSFHRLGDSSTTMMPHGTVESDGSFQLTTFKKNDGAPAGAYEVTIIWRGKKKKASDEEGEWLLPVRYLATRTSGLSVEIQNAPTALPPFQLTR